MPIVKHGAQQSKRQKTATLNQRKQLDIAIDDDDAYFGRVLKINMARCTVNVWDHTTKRHIEVQARLPNKKKGFIKMNDLVNIAKSHPDWEVQIAIDAKATASLRKSGRITAELAAETAAGSVLDDTGIEFDYEGVETTGAVVEDDSVSMKSKAKIDDDFDVDAI